MSGAQHFRTGVGVGIASALYTSAVLNEPLGLVVGLGCAAGVWLPDIDHDQSKLGKKRKVVTSTAVNAIKVIIPIVILIAGYMLYALVSGIRDYGYSSNILLGSILLTVAFVVVASVIGKSSTYKWAVAHRGIWHTIFPALIFLLATRITEVKLLNLLLIGLSIGDVTHLIGDSITVAGVPLLWPITRMSLGLKMFKSTSKGLELMSWVLAVAPTVLVYLMCIR